MKPRKHSIWWALGALLLLSSPAAAQFGAPAEIEPYVTVSAGLAFTPTIESKSFTPVTVSITTERSPNATVGGGIGAVYGYLRHELRADYHRAKVDRITPVFPTIGAVYVPAAGDTIGVTTVLYMVALRQTFLDDKLAVYGGAGIGAAYGVIPVGGSSIKDWEFGYAVTAGTFYDLWRGIGVDLGYRYVSATDFSGTYYSRPSSQFSIGAFPFYADWGAHEIVVSLRYSWGDRD